MALINCPECGKEVSDQRTACPNCGYPIAEKLSETVPQIDAKAEPALVDEVPTSQQENPPAPKKKTLPIIIAAVVVIAIIIGFMMMSKKNAAAAVRTEYIENLRTVRVTMLQGAAEAEGMCNLTVAVWRDCIHKEKNSNTISYITNNQGKIFEDFNDALLKLYKSDSVSEKTVSIIENQYKVDALMRELQNPPDDLRTCYDTANKMYDAYTTLTNLATTPTGSLTSYCSDFRESDDTFMLLYNKLEVQIPNE